jgi:hypothetical protein
MGNDMEYDKNKGGEDISRFDLNAYSRPMNREWPGSGD